MSMVPAELKLADPATLVIRWSDGQRREYRVRDLRDVCPCATCREKRDAPPEAKGLLPILSPAETRPLSIAGMQPVGQYAYTITFSDGHDTGIYTFEFLRALGRELPKP